MKYIFLFIALAANAATITVCASGCTTTSVQTAFDTAVGGDIVQITAGETFEGAFTLPFRTDNGNVLVRSSRYAELPPVGTRVTAANASLMPKLQATNTTSAVVFAGYTERIGTSVNLGTDVITFSSTLNIPNDRPFVCRISVGGTGPLTPYTIYYARDVSGATMKVAATPGGAALDLTTAISGTFTCTRNDSIRGWTFQGIEFSGKAGSPSTNALVNIASDANDRAGIPGDIKLDRVYIHGIQNENGAKNCIVMNARQFSITDSRVESCKLEGIESHSIVMYQTPGPGLIKNNYLDGASENILFGGDFVRVLNFVNGDEGQIEIANNHLFKPLYLKYRAGIGQSGAPVSACTAGAYSIDTASGLVYKCLSTDNWQLSPTCSEGEYFRQSNVTQSCVGGACWHCASGVYVADTVFRAASYFVKNIYECKNCMNIFFHDNVAENNWSGNGDQSGVGIWPISQIYNGNGQGWIRGENLRFVNNILKNSELGFRVATDGSVSYGMPNNRVNVSNNVLIGVGKTDYPDIPDQNATNTGSSFEVGGRCENCSWNHNSSYNAPLTSGRCILFDTSPVTNFFMGNSICGRNTYGVISGSAGTDCAGITASPVFFNSADDLLTNNALIDNQSVGSLGTIGSCATLTRSVAGSMGTHFTSATNLRLLSTSPYSAANPTPTYVSTDGTDLGADVDQVDAATGGAVLGTPSLQSTVQVIVGSTRAIVKYTAPSASTCTLKLYTGVGPRISSTLSSDTPDAAGWTDDRSGNVTLGTSRQFVLGTVSALTASTKYQAVITCGSSIGFAWVFTVSAGAGFDSVTRYATATTGEYSSSATMSSPTSISSSTTHTVPVPAGGVRYYRRTGGPIVALVAP